MTENAKFVAFAGDWHGVTQWAIDALDSIADLGIKTIYHAGDFGLWHGPSGKSYLWKVQRTLEKNGQSIFVVPGNHENYDRLDKMPTDDDGWLFLKDYPLIRFAPRGHTWIDDASGARMGALGGGGSIDKNLRNPHTAWWKQEEITRDDVDTLIESLYIRGWDKLDVLITHEAPSGVMLRGFPTMPVWATPDIQNYCNIQRVLLRNAVDAVMPHTLVHGHWHEWNLSTLYGTNADGQEYETNVFSLDRDGSLKNIIASPLQFGSGIEEYIIIYPNTKGEN